MYNLFFPGVSDAVIPRSYDKYASLECAGERFGSSFSRLNRCSYVLAKWAARFDGGVDMQSADLRPGIIQYFFKHSIFVGGKKYTFSFARVDLFHRHPDRLCAALVISFHRFGVPMNLTVLVQRHSCLSSD